MSRQYTIQFFTILGATPADGAIFNFSYPNTPFLAYDTYKVRIPVTGILKKIFIKSEANIAGSGESVDFYLRINDSIDVGPVSYAENAIHSAGFASVNQAVMVGDFIAAKSVSPTWATNPTVVKYHMILVIEEA